MFELSVVVTFPVVSAVIELICIVLFVILSKIVNPLPTFVTPVIGKF